MMRVDPLNDFTWLLGLDMAEHARELRETWHCNCQWVMANGGSAPGTAPIVNFTTPHFEKNPTLGDRDCLREHVPHAHEAGLRVVAYVNLHWFSNDFAAAHPGWEQLLADGRAYGKVNPLRGNGTTMCVNTAWREWAYLLLAETMRTGVDGAFLDGPVVLPGACHCPVCRALHRERTGVEPRRGDVEPRPRSGAVARHPWRLEAHQFKTGAEEFVHFGPPREDVLDTAVMARFLSAGRNPAVVFSDHALGAGTTWA